jgi:hypothetical protein
MTMRGTTSFVQICDDIISDSLVNLGALGPGVSCTTKPKLRAYGLRALNRVAKAIDASGSFLWRQQRRTVAIAAGTATYGPSLIGTDVMNFQDPADFSLAGSTARSQVWSQTNADFRLLGDRTVTGTPTLLLTEYSLSGLTITLWPTPDNAGTLELMCALRAQDFTLGTDTPDYDTKWNSCLILGTSAEMATAFGQDPQIWKPDFLAAKAELLNDNNPKVALQLVAWGDSGSYGSGNLY